MNPQSTVPYRDLTSEQRVLVERPFDDNILFLEGPAGAGKTTVGAARLRRLLIEGIPANEILILAPQRTLLTPYLNVLRSSDLPPSGTVDALTIGGLARRMVSLFWPLVAERAGFAHPERPPVFLTMETAQYYMARVADPLIEAGAFEEITIDRNRVLSQILDNLNKAALVGLDYRQVADSLRLAWVGSSARAAVYDHAQQCANDFRTQCLTHNLLDFSLQIEVFVKHLLTLPWPPREGFMARFTRYSHLIVDNIEEDTPVTHDLLRSWLPSCESALLIYDLEAGYRVFLGADPTNGLSLRDACRYKAELYTPLVTSPHLRHLAYELARSLRQTPLPIEHIGGDLSNALGISETRQRFHTQMVNWVSTEIAHLVHEQFVPPGEIVIIAPYLSDALRFSLSERLAQLEIPSRSHRPSRALRDESAARCLLALAALAYSEWGYFPRLEDVVQALAFAIDGMDPVRAKLLTRIVYRPSDTDGPQPRKPLLNPFTDLKTAVQERIGYQVGNRYEGLREWLYHPRRAQAHIDHFFGRLFGEVLSQPGYGFHRNFDAGRVTAQLIESARKFRHVVSQPANTPHVNSIPPASQPPARPIGLDYIRMVERGVIAAQFTPAWETPQDDDNAILLAPAYTFLMRNRPVDYQFWLDVGSTGWWERPFQPLTHPYVLTRDWSLGDAWTDAHEVEAQTRALSRLVQGLIRRCRIKIYLGISELGEQGYEQRGPLLNAIQGALRRRAP